jgi:hypothetical protein
MTYPRLRPAGLARAVVRLCIVQGCPERATWTREDSLAAYCPAHIDEWLMAEASIGRRDVE